MLSLSQKFPSSDQLLSLTRLLEYCREHLPQDKPGTVQYSTVQYSTVQYSTVQYSTVQYSILHQFCCSWEVLFYFVYMRRLH